MPQNRCNGLKSGATIRQGGSRTTGPFISTFPGSAAGMRKLPDDHQSFFLTSATICEIVNLDRRNARFSTLFENQLFWLPRLSSPRIKGGRNAARVASWGRKKNPVLFRASMYQ